MNKEQELKKEIKRIDRKIEKLIKERDETYYKLISEVNKRK